MHGGIMLQGRKFRPAALPDPAAKHGASRSRAAPGAALHAAAAAGQQQQHGQPGRGLPIVASACFLSCVQVLYVVSI